MTGVPPLVTIDVPQASQLPAVRPKMAAGDLALTTVERFAPKLARDLLDTFDFSDSVGKGKPASLSVAKAYSVITTAQYRQLAKIDAYRKDDSAWSKGLLGTFGFAALGLGAAFLGMAGAHDMALGVVSALAGAGTCFMTVVAGESFTERSKKLPDECAEIAAEPPLLTAAKHE